MSISEQFDDFNKAFEAPDIQPDDSPDPGTPVVDEAPADVVDTADEEHATDERPRDEKGRFISPEQADKLSKYINKYDGDVDKAYEASVEAQSLIGKLGQELGTLRSQVENLPSQLQHQQAPTLPGDIGDLIAQDPRQVAVWALQNGAGEPVYEAAMQEWFDQDPRAAARFETELRLQQVRSEFEAQTVPVQRTLAEQEKQAAIARFTREHPDVEALAPQIQRVAAEQPFLANALSSDDPTTVVQALSALYTVAKATAPPAPDTGASQQAIAQAQAQALQQAEQAKQEAAVVTGGTNSTGDPAQPSASDEIWERWQELDIGRLKYS